MYLGGSPFFCGGPEELCNEHQYLQYSSGRYHYLQMRISYDDQFLFTVGMDGSLFAFKVTDKEGRGLKREKDITYAEEVLVARSDLEEKVVIV